ncbi:unnamed protein product [Chironomus riparius]|uniref:Uncharacterized protein n=1 Tax=Chironomus riparius TaxID=315576 RepID=A0A9N9WYQ8_9DIPT|nr:unnamed protein product [Chironomus riparius]
MGKSVEVKQVELVEKLVKKFDEVMSDEDALADVLNGLVDALKPLAKDEKQKVQYGELCAIVEGILEYSSGFASKTSTSEKQQAKLKKSLNAIIKIKEYLVCSLSINVEEDYGPQRRIGSDENTVLDQQEASAAK